jgi:hypothetical protein
MVIQLWRYEIQFHEVGSPHAGELARQSSLLVHQLIDSPKASEGICEVSQARRSIAQDMFIRGKVNEAIGLLREDHFMHQSLPAALKDEWRIKLERNVTDSWLGLKTDPPADLKPPLAQGISSFPPGHPLRRYLAQILAARSGWACPDSPMVERKLPTLSAEKFAVEMLAEAIEFSSQLETSEELLPAAALELHNYASILATHERRVGNEVQAERIAQRLFAFAEVVVKNFPESHQAQLLLSEASTQMAKNKLARNSSEALAWLDRSLQAASVAVSKYPEDLEARTIFDRCKARSAKARLTLR